MHQSNTTNPVNFPKMNKHPLIEKILEDRQFERLQNWADIGPVQSATLESYTQQVVGETILAILATDHRHAQFTTFDRAAIEGATARITEAVRKYWSFPR